MSWVWCDLVSPMRFCATFRTMIARFNCVLLAYCTQPGCPLTNIQHGTIQQPSPPLDYHQDDRLYFRRMLSHIKQKSPYRV